MQRDKPGFQWKQAKTILPFSTKFHDITLKFDAIFEPMYWSLNLQSLVSFFSWWL